jgi:hydroxymethylbilane synthase
LRGHKLQSVASSQAHSSDVFVRIGTRGSPLALAQANEVRERLAAIHAIPRDRIKLDVIRTTGDAIRDRPLAEAGGKGLFTKEIDEALLAGLIDLGVHSAKDLPTALPSGLAIAAVPPREDARDVFISLKAKVLRDLATGAVVGTGSLRRQALLKRLRPDLAVVNFRGNVETRLRKLEQGAVDATLLALAGLKRLGLVEKATSILSIDEFLPAVGQGCLAIVVRADDKRVLPLVTVLNDVTSARALAAERAFLAVLDGSCRTPIAGHAVVADGRLRVRGLIAKPDGSAHLHAEREGPAQDAILLGTETGRELKARADPGFFAHS